MPPSPLSPLGAIQYLLLFSPVMRENEAEDVQGIHLVGAAVMLALVLVTLARERMTQCPLGRDKLTAHSMRWRRHRARRQSDASHHGAGQRPRQHRKNPHRWHQRPSLPDLKPDVDKARHLAEAEEWFLQRRQAWLECIQR